jgi:hypothetical protein
MSTTSVAGEGSGGGAGVAMGDDEGEGFEPLPTPMPPPPLPRWDVKAGASGRALPRSGMGAPGVGFGDTTICCGMLTWAGTIRGAASARIVV